MPTSVFHGPGVTGAPQYQLPGKGLPAAPTALPSVANIAGRVADGAPSCRVLLKALSPPQGQGRKHHCPRDHPRARRGLWDSAGQSAAPCCPVARTNAAAGRWCASCTQPWPACARLAFRIPSPDTSCLGTAQETTGATFPVSMALRPAPCWSLSGSTPLFLGRS